MRRKKYPVQTTDGSEITDPQEIIRGEVDDNRFFPEEGVRVRRVSFGLGLFAEKSFKSGDVLGRVHGLILSDPNYSSSYCIDADSPYSLEPFAPFCYLNHCCEPNAKFYHYVYEEDETGENGLPDIDIRVEAIRKIKKGEEILIDYAWPAVNAIPCCCGSPKCRGWIVREEDLPLVR